MNLTRQERSVVLFLVSSMLIGLGISFVTKRCLQIRVIGYLDQGALKLDLNQAKKYQLTDIKGIGEKLAQRIIEYRQNNQGFKTVEELKEIRGIGESKYEAIQDCFKIEVN